MNKDSSGKLVKRKPEGWLTFAKDDEEAKNALVLLHSLRRVSTNRQIILVASPTLSDFLWKPLEESFDVVHLFSKGQNGFQVDATALTLSLVFYKKLIILPSSSLVLENCDELFESNEALALGKKETGSMILEPGIKSYFSVIKCMNKSGVTTDQEKLHKALLTTFKNVAKLDDKFDFHVDETTVKSNQDELLIESPKIVNLENVESLLSQNGHLAPFFQTVWNFSKEYSTQVDQFIESLATTSINHVPWKGYENEPIAIVGMSCRLPESNSVEEFWKLLLDGRCAVRDIPEGRWNKEHNFTLSLENRKVQAGFMSAPVDQFDNKFFSMSPAETEFTDPQHRLLLEITWEALEDACINPQDLHGTRTGIFAGAWTQEYKDSLISSGFKDKGAFFRAYMGNSFGTMGARLAHNLGVTGPNICPESGCSSSLVAVGLAVENLRRGEVTTALACGVNLLLSPYIIKDYIGLLSPQNRSKVFDSEANGFVRGEGCGVLVLKRLSDAVKYGDRIHALIRGFGISQEGTSKSMGTPTVDGEASAMSLALENANILPKDVQVVEAHGTGTSVGDPLEVLAITKVYSTPDREFPLIITAGKANTGHLESASGTCGIIKTICEMKAQTIPPQILINNLNPLIDLDKIPAQISYTQKIWESTGPRIAGISSFGITGTDTHLILQEAPQTLRPDSKFGVLKSPPQNLLTISAKSTEALENLIELYKTFLTEDKGTCLSLDSITYSANTGRAQFPHRVAVWGKNCQDVLEKLEKRSFEMNSGIEDKPISNICFLFTGQGSQFLGMGKVFYNTCPVFKVSFDKCEKILKSLYGLELKDALWGEDASKLHKSLYSQSAIFVMEYCMVKLWESWGIVPNIVVGHSLGEFGAATAAGILSVEDALKLLGARCRLIDCLPNGKMIAVKANEKKSAELVATFVKQQKGKDVWLDTAAINSNEQTTLAGPQQVVSEFAAFCEKNNIKAHILDATHAFHSRAMDPILKEYESIAKSINYRPSTIKFISGVDGKEMENVDANYWVRHTREGVQFSKAASSCFQEGEAAPLFIEVGPHPVLSALVHANAPTHAKGIKCFPSMRKPPTNKTESTEWQTILDTLSKLYISGIGINFKQFHRFHPKNKVKLPFYPFQRKFFWMASDTSSVSKAHFHPLLGSKIALPKTPDHDYFDSTRQTRFQNFITIKTNDYICDHKVGKFALMPAAGYVEMFLAAASTAFVQEFPIILENIKILSPCVVDNVAREIHTVLTFTEEDKNVLKLSAFGREADAKTNATWNLHSESIANLASLSLTESEKEDLIVEDLIHVQKRLCDEEPSNLDIYKQMAAQGYNFGKAFQSLGSAWTLGRERLTKVSIPSELQDQRDFCHPILMDAMIQALILSSVEKLVGLYLPIAIKKFVLLDTSFLNLEENQTTLEFFIHVKDVSPEDETQKVAILYHSNGTPVALMFQVELVKTPLIALEKRLEAMKKENEMPTQLLEEWHISNVFSSNKFQTSFLEETEIITELETNPIETDKEDDEKSFEIIDTGITNSIMLSLLELGLKPPKLGEWLETREAMKVCGVKEEMYRITRRFLEILTESGHLLQSHEDINKFQTIKMFPPQDELKRNQDIFLSEKTVLFKTNEEKPIHAFYMQHSKDFLAGTQNILTCLFPEDDNDIYSALKIYTTTKLTTRMGIAFKAMLPLVFNQCSQTKKSIDSKSGMLRILEIGAGTGSITQIALPILAEMDVKYSYTYTDVSNIFFIKAKETFEPYLKNIKFKVLNIEEDPKSLGFAPDQFDIVICSNVLHATRNLTETCRNIRLLMKNFGILLIGETLIPQYSIDSCFGMLSGYWRQLDTELRPKHCVIGGNQWSELLSKTGFMDDSLIVPTNGGRTGVILAKASAQTEKYISPVPIKTEGITSISKNVVKNTWLVFGESYSPLLQNITNRLEQLGKNVFEIELNSERFKENGNNLKINGDSLEDFEAIYNSLRSHSTMEDIEGFIHISESNPSDSNVCEEMTLKNIQRFLFFLQSMLKEWPIKLPKLVVVTRGVNLIGDQSSTLPSTSPILGMFRTFMSENISPTKYIDLSEEIDAKLDTMQIVFELWSDDADNLISYRGGYRHVIKLINSPRLGLPYPPLDLHTSTSARRFHILIPDTHSIANLTFETHNTKPVLKPLEVELEVKASALNFRDVLSVLKPTPQFDDVNAIGLDVCGIVVALGSEVTNRKLGDVVLGCNYQNLALPSHVIMHESSMVNLPPQMTFAEGATLPTVFITVYHCLVTVAKLKAGETILIHTASGGVGLCAVQIAQDIGAKIVATAGSKRKRAYLNFIGVKDVFNSRDLTFGEGIKNATKGRGVDVVLNSLTSSGFKETSLECCAKNARFVEMSKLNIWKVEEVKELRPDLNYSVEDLSSDNQERMKFLLEEFEKYLNHPIHPLKPLPYTRFDVVDIRSALAYLEKAKQIGKVICVFPEPPTKESDTLNIKLFNDKSTYLVTGGCAGIGFEVMKYLCNNGARTVVICGRRLPSEENMKEIESLKNTGKNILVAQGDIGDKKRTKEILDWIKKELPPLRGIMHSAGCLSDDTIPNQTMEKYEITINPKIRGGWNLHTLTLDSALEHFVMFSSASVTLGNFGQSNHSACNTFLDKLAIYRRSMGLVASTINWGQWGEIGVAVGKDLLFCYPMTTREAFNALSNSLRTNAVQSVVAQLDFELTVKYFPKALSMLELVLSNKRNKGTSEGISSEVFWRSIEEAETDELKYLVVKGFLSRIVTKMLRLDEDIDPNQNFQDMGMDSLMMIELKNQVQIMLGPDIAMSTAEMADCKTLHLTTQKLMDIIYSSGPNALISRNQLITQDSKLWDSVNITNSIPPLPITEVNVIFMTGSTGTLGPYTLQQLTQYSQVQKIVCLVRCRDMESAKERLVNRLTFFNLLDKTDMSKVSVVNGDLTQDLFGLGEEHYNKLASEMQAIIHCAVYTSHLEMYGRGASETKGIKAVNVIGTQRVLEFAAKNQVKHVYNASTLLGAFYKSEKLINNPEAILAEWAEDSDADEALNFGYGISKFISDRLVAQAVERGIPCKAFRFPKIVGEKDTGRQEMEHSHFFIKFIYFMQAGMMPEVDIPLQVIPVDTSAQVSLQLFFDPRVPSDMFNILNPHYHMETEIGMFAPEYGPIFRITEHLWKIKDEIKELKKVKETDEKNLVPKFLQLLNERAKQEDIDLEPIMDLLKEIAMTQDVINNPAILFKNEKVRVYLKENYGQPMRLVPFKEFIVQLKKDGERAKLYKWIDFYDSKDSFYNIIELNVSSGQYDQYKDKPAESLGKSCRKLTQYIPNYSEIVIDSLESVRNDFDYAIDHSVEAYNFKSEV